MQNTTSFEILKVWNGRNSETAKFYFQYNFLSLNSGSNTQITSTFANNRLWTADLERSVDMQPFYTTFCSLRIKNIIYRKIQIITYTIWLMYKSNSNLSTFVFKTAAANKRDFDFYYKQMRHFTFLLVQPVLLFAVIFVEIILEQNRK